MAQELSPVLNIDYLFSRDQERFVRVARSNYAIGVAVVEIDQDKSGNVRCAIVYLEEKESPNRPVVLQVETCLVPKTELMPRNNRSEPLHPLPTAERFATNIILEMYQQDTGQTTNLRTSRVDTKGSNHHLFPDQLEKIEILKKHLIPIPTAAIVDALNRKRYLQ